jgi:hypothetical protein
MPHRLPCRHAFYARAKGRNGWFVPRVVEFEVAPHEDGTPLLKLRMYSRRESPSPPLEVVVALAEWEAQVLAIQLRINEERRGWTRGAQRGQPRDT